MEITLGNVLTLAGIAIHGLVFFSSFSRWQGTIDATLGAHAQRLTRLEGAE